MAEGFITRRGGSPLKFGTVLASDTGSVKSITIPDLIGYKDFVLIANAHESGLQTTTYYAKDYYVLALYVENGKVTHMVTGSPRGSGVFALTRHTEPNNMTYDVSTGTVACTVNYSFNFDMEYVYLYF